MTTQVLANGLVSGCSHGLLALSFAVIYSTGRFFHLAHASCYTLGAYSAFAAAAYLGANPGVAVGVGVIAAAAAGIAMEILVYRPIRRRGGTPQVLLLASVGLLVVLQNCVSLVFGDAIKPMPGVQARAGYVIFGAHVTQVQIITFLVSLVVFFGVLAGLKLTWIGRRIRAVVDNPQLANAVGIDSNRVLVFAFCVGSALAGLAAAMSAYDTGLRPSMGFSALLLAVVAMVIGGVGHIPAAYFGGFVVAAAQQCSALVLPTKWQDAVVFALLIVFLLFRPGGLLGAENRKVSV